MSGLVDNVMSHLGDDQIQQIANQLGIDPASARNAVEQALPLIVAGMARNASTDAGAGALHSALGDHVGTNVSDVLGGLLNGAGGSGGLGGMLGGVLGGGNAGTGGFASGVGGAILGHIFGNNANAANQGLGQTTGLGTHNAEQLLAILAPIVMSVLANHAHSQGLSPGALGGVLAQQGQQIQQQGGLTGGLLSAVLDRNGDGKVDLSDLIAGAGTVMNAMNRRA